MSDLQKRLDQVLTRASDPALSSEGRAAWARLAQAIALALVAEAIREMAE